MSLRVVQMKDYNQTFLVADVIRVSEILRSSISDECQPLLAKIVICYSSQKLNLYLGRVANDEGAFNLNISVSNKVLFLQPLTSCRRLEPYYLLYTVHYSNHMYGDDCKTHAMHT